MFYQQIPANVIARLENDSVPIYLIAEQDEVLSTDRMRTLSNSKIRLAGLTTHPRFVVYRERSTGKVVRVERAENGVIEIQTDATGTTVMDPYRIIHEIGH